MCLKQKRFKPLFSNSPPDMVKLRHPDIASLLPVGHPQRLKRDLAHGGWSPVPVRDRNG